MTRIVLCFMTFGSADGRNSADLITMSQDLAEAWKEGGPARSLRVRCQFDLTVEHQDDALGDAYFPNTPAPVSKRLHPRYRAQIQTKWVEDIAKRHNKFRYKHSFSSPDPKTQRAWTSDKFFNGKNSWVYNSGKQVAFQYPDVGLTARLTLGYYQDMIGFPGNPLAKTRTTAGDTGEVYQLDRLIPTGRYLLEGETRLNDEDCVILARPGLDRLWLAKSRGWAIVKREWCWSMGGPLKRRIIGRDFREIAPGAWIPLESMMEIYGHPKSRPGKRVGVLKARVLEASADISDDWFEPRFPEGTEIYDQETGGEYKFGKELLSLDAAVNKASQFRPMFHPVSWWQTSGAKWSIVVLITASGLCGAWKARKYGGRS